MALRMRKSLDELEQAFRAELRADRERRESLRRTAAARSRQRQVERVHKRGTLRFVLLVLALVATAVVVTIVMFQTLYWVMG
jgi:anti-sigma-K factor RskA